MKKTRSRFLAAGCALSLAVCGLASPAFAQAVDSPAVAEALFQQGRELFKANKFAEACDKFAESQRIDAKLGTLLNLAHCHEKVGKIATAWAEYTSAATIARREGQKERETFAREQVEALAKKLAHVVVKVAAPTPGLAITLDGKPVAGAVLDVPVPIDPGKHRVVATAPGRQTWSMEVDVPAARADIVVKIPALAPEGDKPAVVPPVPPPAQPPPDARQAPPDAPAKQPASGGRSPLVYVGFGIGGAGVLVGAVTGILTLAKSGDIRDACKSGTCPASQRDALDSATALANVSNVAFGIGIAGIGLGVVGLLISRQPPKAARAATLTPFIGPTAIGLRGAF